MNRTILIALVGLVLNHYALADAFPIAPHGDQTPGVLCSKPTEYRYPEKIPYCARSVGSELKKQIIAQYDLKYGYQIQKMNRADFKIDHFIPLCMGGGNEASNLWPQHKSVYEITDSIEALACEKMKIGLLLQTDAVRMIKIVKNDLSRADEITQKLNELK